MVALAKVLPGRMSVSEFLAWSAREAGRWELVDGEPRAMAPPSRTQGAIQAELGALLRNHLREHAPSCSVVAGPGIIPRLHASTNFRIPDLAVTCRGYEAEEAALAEPVLIVEILSPSNQANSWANVWAYTSIPSVQEILILRSDAVGGELVRRNASGAWSEIALGEEDALSLDSIGLALLLADAYATTRLARR